MKLASLANRWKAVRSPIPEAVAAIATAGASFTSYVGDVGIGEITADNCFEYRDAIALIPESMPRA